MSLESKARAYVGKFRISQAGFEAPTNQTVESNIRQNPERRYNPLGGSVPELSVVVLSDTHLHIEGRETFDRTAMLPTTRAMNIIRRHTGQRPADWHREVRPALYNNALMEWPNAIGEFLDARDIPQTNHVLLVHGGDMGDDALNQAELGVAITRTQDVIDQIGQRFTSAWGADTTIQPIYAVGNHDADYIAWPMAERTRQIQWFYEKLGLTEHPACFLQEVQDSTRKEKGKALLVIDTNLLDDAWAKGVREASAQALEKLKTKIDVPNNAIEAIATNPQFLDKIKSLDADQEQLVLLRDALLFSLIQRHMAEQDEMIKTAQGFRDLVIVGHKPKETLAVAKECEGNATVIAGDVHFAYDSERANRLIKLPKKKTKSGSPIRVLLIGGATRGGMGIEIPGKATAFMLTMKAEDEGIAPNHIFEISQNNS